MAQFNWTYVSDEGKQYKVGLFHGNKTGHILIHVNNKIVQIDFSVYESKTYSIFLDEELCEIKLEQKDGKFLYDLKVNKEVDTPLNRARKKEEKKYWKQTLLFFGGLIALVLILLAFVRSANTPSTEKARQDWLSIGSNIVPGKIVSVKEEEEKVSIKMTYVVANQSQKSEQIFEQNTPVKNSLGMSIKSGDEYFLRYATANLKVAEIILDSLTPNQKERFQTIAFQKQLSAHPNQSEYYIECLFAKAEELAGPNAWAHFYFQDTEPSENTLYNKNAYKRLIRGGEFQKAVNESCW